MVDELGFGAYEPPARRRRRVWPWLIVLAIVVVLVAAAAVAAEAIARGLVTAGVRTLVSSQVDSTGEIDVDVPGLIVPQLLSGTLDQVDVSADDVSIGGLTGDVSVTALGVPLSGDAPARGGTATVRLDTPELQALLSRIDGFPAEDVGMQTPDVTFSTALSLFGVDIPIGVSLAPGAADGALTLTPTAFEAAGGTVDAEQLRQQLGGLADGVIRDWSICIEDQLPSALTLTGVTVDASNELVATFDVNGAVVVDRSLLQPGSCG